MLRMPFYVLSWCVLVIGIAFIWSASGKMREAELLAKVVAETAAPSSVGHIVLTIASTTSATPVAWKAEVTKSADGYFRCSYSNGTVWSSYGAPSDCLTALQKKFNDDKFDREQDRRDFLWKALRTRILSDAEYRETLELGDHLCGYGRCDKEDQLMDAFKLQNLIVQRAAALKELEQR